MPKFSGGGVPASSLNTQPTNQPTGPRFSGGVPASQLNPPPVSTELPPADAESRTWGEAALDTYGAAAGGVNALVGLTGTLYGLATGHTENWARRQGEIGQEYWEGKKSTGLLAREKKRQQAIDAADGELAKAGAAFWETLSDSALLTTFLSAQVPNLAAGGGAGALAKAGAGKILSAQAAQRVGIGAAATAGAGMQGGDVAENAMQRLEAIPDAMYMENPEVKLRISQGVDPEQAIDDYILQLSQDSFKASAAISLATNLLPGAMQIEKRLMGVKVPKGGRLVNAGKGMLGEAAQEATEEGSGQVIANRAVQNVDPNQKTFEGVGAAAGQGAVAGLLGLGAGATQAEGPNAKPVDDGIDEILNATTADEAIAATEKALGATLDPSQGGDMPAGTPIEQAVENLTQQLFGEAIEPTPYKAQLTKMQQRAMAGGMSEADVLAAMSQGEQVRAQADYLDTTDAQAPTEFEYGSSQVNLPDDVGVALQRAVTDLIDPADLNLDEGGIENEPHVTVQYGFDESQVEAISEALETQPPGEMTVEGIEVFQPEGRDYDVLVMRVESDQLRQLRELVGDVAPAEGDSFPEYKPHITLAYVSRGAGEKYAEAVTGLEGSVIPFDQVEVSNKAGDKVSAVLRGEALSERAGETEPDSAALQEPDPEVLDTGVPEPEVAYFDNRLKREQYRTELRNRADELYSRKDQGTGQTEGGRVASMNPDWFKRMTGSGSAISVGYVRGTIRKALRGGELGPRQQEMVAGLLDELRDERLGTGALGDTNVDNARAKLADARDRRRIERQTGPDAPPAVAGAAADFYASIGETFSPAEYEADWDLDTRALFDMAEQLDAVGGDSNAILDAAIQNDEAPESTLGAFETALETAYADQRQATETGQDGRSGAEAPAGEQGQRGATSPEGNQEQVAESPAPDVKSGKRVSPTNAPAGSISEPSNEGAKPDTPAPKAKALSSLAISEKVRVAETGEIVDVEVTGLAAWTEFRRRVLAAQRVLECARNA